MANLSSLRKTIANLRPDTSVSLLHSMQLRDASSMSASSEEAWEPDDEVSVDYEGHGPVSISNVSPSRRSGLHS